MVKAFAPRREAVDEWRMPKSSETSKGCDRTQLAELLRLSLLQAAELQIAVERAKEIAERVLKISRPAPPADGK
jgi:hypothetical protein